MPNAMTVTLLDHGDDAVTPASAVFSSKAIGEPPIMLCSGIVSAARHAITSYRNDQVKPEAGS
jgi:xanthine dehydrogenase molybdopterin-binding subunit B